MIDLADLETRRLVGELRKIVQRLALVSHAPIQGYNLAPSENGRGERWRSRDTRPPIPHLGSHMPKGGDTQEPRGEVDWRGDKTPEYRQKSHLYFQRTITRWERSAYLYTAGDLASLLGEAEDALTAWLKTPVVAGVELERGSFRWFCAIADDDRPIDKIKEHYSVGKSTIYRYRAKYRGVLASWGRAA